MRKHLLRIIIGSTLVALFALHNLGVINLWGVHQMELWSYDQRLHLTMTGGMDDRIVIVDIDEKSLAEVGRWPWSRNVVAKLLEQLFDRYQVAVVGFDVVFAEPDTSSGIGVLDRLARQELKDNGPFRDVLAKNRRRFDYDALLAAQMKGRPVVLGYYFTNDEPTKARTSGLLPPPTLVKGGLVGGQSFVPVKNGYGANIPILQKAAAAAGHFNPDPDFDGVTRRVPLLQEYQGNYYEALSLAVLRTMFGQPGLRPVFPGGPDSQLEWLQTSDLKIPVDAAASALIPYRGRQGSFPYISASDIVSGRLKKEQLEGAIVLIGTTAPGLMDLRSTPVSAVYAGVEIHANMIAGMLDNSIKHAPPYARTVELIIILVAGGLLACVLPLLGPLSALGLTLVCSIGLVVGNLAAWQQHLVLPLAAPLILLSLLYLANATWGFLVESRAKRHITSLFGQYVPPQIVSVMSKDPEHFTMAAEEREMTVLFTDVVGFTSISERLTPQELATFMNEYLSAMTAIIYQYGGTVDKYIGDAIMAFWGAPLADPDHALHAIQAAQAMRRRMVSLQQEMTVQGFPEIKIGIGINTGTMRVGNMGSSYRVAYTAMGDAVNLASRLESLTRQYDTWIIVGQETQRRVPGSAWRELDLVRVKGKHEPVAIFEPCGEVATLAEEYSSDIKLFNEMIACYRRQEWQQAESILTGLVMRKPDRKLYQLYLERVRQYQASPPSPEWDGVCTFTTK